MSLRGWRIVHTAGDEETDYKFHHSTKLGPGEEATVRLIINHSIVLELDIIIILLSYAEIIDINLHACLYV